MPQEIVEFLFADVRTSALLTRPSLMSVGLLARCHQAQLFWRTEKFFGGGGSSLVSNVLKDTIILKALNGHANGLVFNN